MSNSLKQARRILLVIFAATTGLVACESATAPDTSVAETVRAVDRQVVDDDLMEELEIEELRRKGSGSERPAE